MRFQKILRKKQKFRIIVVNHNIKYLCIKIENDLLNDSGVHKRSDVYSSLLSKPQLFSMAWWTFKMLLPTWQAGSKQVFIGVFKKVEHVIVSQETPKLQAVELFYFSKNTFLFLCIILSYENRATYEHWLNQMV